MTVIKNSMFPFRSSFQHISNMKDRFDQLQGQLATGQKAATLAEMGSSRFFDLTMRARLSKIAGYQDIITSVNLRLDVLDKTMTRLDALEADQRTLATPGSYGSSNINLTTTPDLSLARLDEVLDLLNATVDGRYLFGGGTTDRQPVEETSVVLDGYLGRDGFRTVVGERKLADAGPDGLGRLDITSASDTVTLAEDGTHPFGFKLSTLSTSSSNIALTQPAGAPPSQSVQFTGLPVAGEKVTIGLTLPDGSQEVVELVAATGSGDKGTFQIGAATAGSTIATQPSVATAAGTLTINGQNFAVANGDDASVVAGLINANGLVGVTATVGTGADAGKLILIGNTSTTDVDVTATVAGLGVAVANYQAKTASEVTADNFANALQTSLGDLGKTKLAAASTFAAADNFFNEQGVPVLRVDGPPFDTATAMVAATPADTVSWYGGETQGIRASDLGRLYLSTTGATTTLTEAAPLAPGYGFRIASVAEGLTNATATLAASSPESLSVAFTGLPNAGETLTVRLTLPQGGSKDVTLRAVAGAPGPGEFTIGADANATSANFGAALNTSLGLAAQEAAGTARGTVTARVEDHTTVKYGVQANENGIVNLVRSLAAMAVETYPQADPSTPGRFDGMAERQQRRLSEAHNNEAGSIEVITVELSLASIRTGNIKERLTTIDAQLNIMLEEIEGVSKEEVAMEILALQTRLEASYQTTALLGKMSLVNYL